MFADLRQRKQSMVIENKTLHIYMRTRLKIDRLPIGRSVYSGDCSRIYSPDDDDIAADVTVSAVVFPSGAATELAVTVTLVLV